MTVTNKEALELLETIIEDAKAFIKNSPYIDDEQSARSYLDEEMCKQLFTADEECMITDVEWLAALDEIEEWIEEEMVAAGFVGAKDLSLVACGAL